MVFCTFLSCVRQSLVFRAISPRGSSINELNEKRHLVAVGRPTVSDTAIRSVRPFFERVHFSGFSSECVCVAVKLYKPPKIPWPAAYTSHRRSFVSSVGGPPPKLIYLVVGDVVFRICICNCQMS